MQASLVITVLNEEKTIKDLLISIAQQTVVLYEVIIVDGGSTDSTLSIITDFQKSFKKGEKYPRIRVIKKRGNRAVGRNEGVKQAKRDIILFTDAGCVLDKQWHRYMSQTFLSKKTGVVAGYYKGLARTLFEKCLVPYVLVMPDKVDPKNFLPATRSMGIRKSVWKKVGGFNEDLSHNEDYAFARKLKANKIPISFQKKAIVYWIPRKNIKDAFIMFFRFALGDAQARIFRPKVALVFIRYVVVGFLLIIFFMIQTTSILYALALLVSLYIVWSVTKNYRYIHNPQAFVYLPLLQVASDLAIIVGSTIGFLSFLR